MKTTITVREYSDLSSGVTPIKQVSTPATPKLSPQPDDPTDEDFRERLYRRQTAPFPHQRWGLNE